MSEDLDVTIVSEEDAYWIAFQTKSEQLIKELQDELKFQNATLEMINSKIA